MKGKIENTENTSKSNAQSVGSEDKGIENRQSLPSRFPPIQRKSNNTGLPDNLKSGMENISGHSLDDVKVHYNSPKPSSVNAHAYAQGSDIHVASGQEKHLPHETAHVVQQKEGRVKPTTSVNGMSVNDNSGLESEADSMGAKALNSQSDSNSVIQNKSKSNIFNSNVSQLKPITTQVTGITHLVKMVGGHIYNEDFESNEERELEDGDRITIDSDKEVLSRRGPNQENEANNKGDKDSSIKYSWFLVSKINNEDVSGKELYIRKDTYETNTNSSINLENADNAMDIFDNGFSLADLSMGITNYGDHAADGSSTNFKSAADHFSFDGVKKGTDAKSNNNAWGDAGTGIVGGAIGGLGALSSLYQGGKGAIDSIKNRKDFYDKDALGKAESIGSGVETLANTTSSVMGAVNSINNASGAIGGNAHWNKGLGAFGGEAIPIMGAITGGMAMVKNSAQIGKNLAQRDNLRDIQNNEEKSEETRGLAKYAANTASKRAKRAGVNLAANTLSTAGSVASATGAGVGVGATLAAAGASIKYGAMAARNIKQTMRDRRANKKNKKTGDEESYAAWSKRQKDKIKETTSWRLKAKYEFILKTTLNWDKTTDKKDEERDNMAQSLINLAIEGDDDLADAIDILKNIGGSKKHIAEISNYVNDKPSQAKMNKMKDKISELFHKRE
ncbi:MAG: DUF4157 domain-containing protein [Crocinitomicaceae bacterium]